MSVGAAVIQERHPAGRNSSLHGNTQQSPIVEQREVVSVVGEHGQVFADVVSLFIGDYAPHARSREKQHASDYLKGEKLAFEGALRPYFSSTPTPFGAISHAVQLDAFRAVLREQFVRRLGRDAYLSGTVHVEHETRQLSGVRLDEMKSLLGPTKGPLFLQFLNGVSEVARIHIDALA